jgi:hypothetical protein
VCWYGDRPRKVCKTMWLPTSCTRTTSREGASRHSKNLIASQFKTNAGRRTPVEAECIHRFKDVPAGFIPRISLCEDAFPQALGAIAASACCTTSTEPMKVAITVIQSGPDRRHEHGSRDVATLNRDKFVRIVGLMLRNRSGVV